MTSEPTRPAGPPRLFAYGTLAPGRPNQHVLADVPGTWEPAKIAGRLVHEGWGSTFGYPALVLDDETADFASGMLFASDALDDNWGLLDEFEGPGYDRVTVVVTLGDGTRRTAQTYVLRRAG